MSDLISRQAAIDAIGEKSDEIFKTKQKGATYPHDDFFQGMAYAENVVKQLPPASSSEIPNSSDTISRAKAIEALDKRFDSIPMEQTSEILMLRKDLRELPPAQPERIKGHWIEIALSNHTYKCSVCGRLLVNITDGKNNVTKNYPYCHCGADMREVTT